MDEDKCKLVAHQAISKQVENQDDVTGSSRSIDLEDEDDREELSTSMEVNDRCDSLNYFSESAAVEQQNESTEVRMFMSDSYVLNLSLIYFIKYSILNV